MPHKRNPIKSEQVAGLARVLRGNAQAALENVALWHERDISHSSVERIILPDSTSLLDHLQRRVLALVEGMVVDERRMRENLELTHGALFSQRVLLALVQRGLTRDDAYRIVQRLAQQAIDERTPLRELLAADPAGEGLDLDTVFDYRPFVRHADEIVARLDQIAAPPPPPTACRPSRPPPSGDAPAAPEEGRRRASRFHRRACRPPAVGDGAGPDSWHAEARDADGGIADPDRGRLRIVVPNR